MDREGGYQKRLQQFASGRLLVFGNPLRRKGVSHAENAETLCSTVDTHGIAL
jgi:hypothetical protein